MIGAGLPTAARYELSIWLIMGIYCLFMMSCIIIARTINNRNERRNNKNNNNISE